jgi:hypothetical protein
MFHEMTNNPGHNYSETLYNKYVDRSWPPPSMLEENSSPPAGKFENPVGGDLLPNIEGGPPKGNLKQFIHISD